MREKRALAWQRGADFAIFNGKHKAEEDPQPLAEEVAEHDLSIWRPKAHLERSDPKHARFQLTCQLKSIDFEKPPKHSDLTSRNPSGAHTAGCSVWAHASSEMLNHAYHEANFGTRLVRNAK